MYGFMNVKDTPYYIVIFYSFVFIYLFNDFLTKQRIHVENMISLINSELGKTMAVFQAS